MELRQCSRDNIVKGGKQDKREVAKGHVRWRSSLSLVPQK